MVTIKPVFWNETEQRIRAGWRVLAYTLLWLFAPALANFLIGRWLVTPLVRVFPPVSTLAPHVIAIFLKLVIVLVGTSLAAHLLDRRPFVDYGFHLNQTWWVDFGFGLALGALLMTLIFGVEWFIGWVTITQMFRVALPGISFGEGMVGALLFFGVYYRGTVGARLPIAQSGGRAEFSCHRGTSGCAHRLGHLIAAVWAAAHI
jgi:uncharacterized protein